MDLTLKGYIVREFMPLSTTPLGTQYYTGHDEDWMVIFKDPEDTHWSVYLIDLTRTQAFAVAEGLNLKEKSDGN